MSKLSKMQRYRQAKYSTIKAFSLALGCSTSKASGILQGQYVNADSAEVRQIAEALGISFNECCEAMAEANAQYHGY